MIAIAAAVLAVLLAIVGVRWVASRAFRETYSMGPEEDGTRVLIAPYELCMLKAHPRCIVGNVNGKTIMVPADADWKTQTEVNRYAVVEQWIVGRVDPRRVHLPQPSDAEDPTSTYFILDTQANTVAYSKVRSEWCGACKSLGIDCEKIVWQEPNPKP